MMKQIVSLLLCMVLATGMLFGHSNGQAYAEGNTKQSADIAFDTTIESARVVVDGIVHHFDLHVADGVWYISSRDAQSAFGDTFDKDYVALDDYARLADMRYTQDEVLNAAYFSTWEPYVAKVSLDGFEMHAEALKLPLDKLGQSTISGAEMAELLDCFVIHEASEQMDDWKKISSQLRVSHAPLCRSDALASLFLAAWKIGGVYMEYEKESSMQMRDAAFDKSDDKRNWELFNGAPIPGEFDVGYDAVDHYGAGSCVFNLGTISPVDASHPFSYDGTSFRHDENATYLEAVVAVCRVFSNLDTQIVSVDDPAATLLSGLFTEKLLDKAMVASTVTAENHPQWTGFVLNGEMDFNLKEVPDNVVQCANWGFNSVRLNLHYEQIFNREVTEVNLAMLNVLDQIVAQAVKNNMHLNICLTSLPGRWKVPAGDYEEAGEFDLFLNEEKQEQAKRVFKVLAERYKGFSNDYLSFTPVWEAMNHNLSSGLPFDAYTYNDYAASLSEFVGVIHSIDPERLIIVEPTMLSNVTAIARDTEPVYMALADAENIIASYNFCEAPFVYACMTSEAGRNIDDENRSYYLVDYPTCYYDLDNCIVDPQTAALRDMMPEGSFVGSASLLIEGSLPAGTTVELYLRQTYGGKLQFIADGQVVYTEELGHNVYNVGEPVSGYINYASSDKMISVTLNEATEQLEIATPDDLCDKEHKENRLIIHDDLSYSTSTVRESASSKTILNLVQTIEETQPGSIIRYERALFNGGISEAMMAYYTDMYTALNERGIGWWSNDWWVMTNDMSESMAGVQQTSYGQYACFNLELLKLMQRYQNNERP